MSWEFVFKYRWRSFEGKMPEAVNVCLLAYETGYKFFLFNGVVYFVVGSNTYFDTGIISEDLF